jgi:plasmid stability protein
MATLNIKNLPDPLYRKLKRRAKLQHRSVAQEVTSILEHVLAEPDELSLLELDGLGSALWKGIDAAHHVEEERGDWDR